MPKCCTWNTGRRNANAVWNCSSGYVPSKHAAMAENEECHLNGLKLNITEYIYIEKGFVRISQTAANILRRHISQLIPRIGKCPSLIPGRNCLLLLSVSNLSPRGENTQIKVKTWNSRIRDPKSRKKSRKNVESLDRPIASFFPFGR